MRKLAVSLGVIAVALAVASPALAGKYRTSPKEGKSIAQKYSQFGKWPFRSCWRIGGGGAGSYGILPGGIVCRFSSPPEYTPDYGWVCAVNDEAVKQDKKHKARPGLAKKTFQLEDVTVRGQSRWAGDWCNRIPSAVEPPPPTGAIGPALF